MGSTVPITSFFSKRGSNHTTNEGLHKKPKIGVDQGQDVNIPSTREISFYEQWTRKHDILKRVYHHQNRSKNHKKDNEKSESNVVYKVIAFDLDSTLVNTNSPVPHPRNEHDWSWFNDIVKSKLHKLSRDDNTILAIFSNQGGVVPDGKRYVTFTRRLDHIMDDLSGAEGENKDKEEHVEVWAYAAIKVKKTDKEQTQNSAQESKKPVRKPDIGLWLEFVSDLKQDMPGLELDMENCVFVGDAAGRKGDFSDSDRRFAENVGLRFFTPEEYFSEAADDDDDEQDCE